MIYDYIIVGTGQSTATLLGKLIPLGMKIAVIEGNEIGGSCVNYGCTPTKTLVASARAFQMAKRGDFYGFRSNELSLDFGRVMERMNEVRGNSKKGFTRWMEETENVTLIRGWARFVGERKLEVNGNTIEGKIIFINVGTRPAAPPIKNLESVPWMDSQKLLELDTLPKHLLIIGGGYIGVEFSQVFRRLGSKVTIIQRGNQLMPMEDSDVSESIKDFLIEEGVEILFNSTTTRANSTNQSIELEIESDGKKQVISGTHLLIAAGRTPNSDTLNLEAAGIETYGRGYIKVDEFCRTNADGVFAVGDVNGHGAFTHTSVNDAEIVLDFLFGGKRTLYTRIPIYGLFTDPPLGRVGLSEKQAISNGHKVLRAIKPMSEISRAKEMGETKGFAKLLVDAQTDLILGAAILGPGGDEIINMFAAIMHSKIPCKNYREVVLVHPTVSELMPWVLDGLQPIN